MRGTWRRGFGPVEISREMHSRDLFLDLILVQIGQKVAVAAEIGGLRTWTQPLVEPFAAGADATAAGAAQHRFADLIKAQPAGNRLLLKIKTDGLRHAVKQGGVGFQVPPAGLVGLAGLAGLAGHRAVPGNHSSCGQLNIALARAI